MSRISESGRCGTATECIGKIRRRRGTWTWCHECDQGYGLKRALCGTDRTSDRRDRRGFNLLFCNFEQVPSAVGLGVLVDVDGSVKQAGGFIIQLMPFTPDEVVDALEKKSVRLRL